jgi:hypothetical protein
MGRPMPVDEFAAWSASWLAGRRGRDLDSAVLH